MAGKEVEHGQEEKAADVPKPKKVDYIIAAIEAAPDATYAELVATLNENRPEGISEVKEGDIGNAKQTIKKRRVLAPDSPKPGAASSFVESVQLAKQLLDRLGEAEAHKLLKVMGGG